MNHGAVSSSGSRLARSGFVLHTEQVVETDTRRTSMISHPLVKEMSPDCFFLPFL